MLNVPGAPHYDASLEEDTIYDHSKETSDGGWSADNNLTISGGNNMTTFYLSFGHFFEKGHWEAGSDYERFSSRVKASQVLSEKMKVTANIAYVHSNANYLQRGDNAIGMGIASLRSPPEWNNRPYLHEETGYHRSYRYPSAKVLRANRKFDNPFFIMYEHENPVEVDRAFGNLKWDYDPFNWVNVSYILGVDASIDDRYNLVPLCSSREAGNGRLRRVNYKSNEFDGNLVATFQMNRLFTELKNINATFLVGHNFNIRDYKRFRVTGVMMGPAGFNQLDNFVDITPNEYKYKIHTESFFGQATLDLWDQLYLTGAIRNEGSSTFGAAKKRHWFPKASAAWEFTKFKEIPGLSFGKVRFAWGVAGVQPGVYSTGTGFGTGTLGFPVYTDIVLESSYLGKSGYYSLNSPANDNIGPERTREYEIGTNLAFWNNRIGLEFTYYNSKASDVLLDINLVPSTGYFDRLENGAVIENKGIEATLDFNPIKMRNFSWNLTFNYARNQNMVIDMMDVGYEDISRWGVAMAGHPLNEHRVLSWVRFGHGEEVGGVNIDEAYAGQWKKNDVYIPENGYPIMSSELRMSGLSTNPDWSGSIRTEFTLFNNLTISGLVDIVEGYWIMNHGKGALYSYGTAKDTENRWHPDYEDLGIDWGKGTVDRFFKHGEKGIGPGAGTEVEYTEVWYKGAGSGFSGDGFQFIEDASYIKLREVSISYTLRHALIRRFGLSDVRVRLSGNNLITWSDYTGYDPETNRQQASGSRGGDYFNQPQVRSYNLTFYFNL